MGNELIKVDFNKPKRESFSNKKKKPNCENKITKTSPFVSNETTTKTKTESIFENNSIKPAKHQQQVVFITTKAESREVNEYEKINTSDYIIDETSLILSLFQEPLIDTTTTTRSDTIESLFLSENFQLQNQDTNSSNSNTSDFDELIDGIIELADGIENEKQIINSEKPITNNVDFSEFLNMEDIDKMLNFNVDDYSFNEKAVFNELIF